VKCELNSKCSKLGDSLVHDQAFLLRKVFLLSACHLAKPSEGISVGFAEQIQGDHDMNGQLGRQLVVRALLDPGDAALNERLRATLTHRIVVHNLGDSFNTHVDQVVDTDLLNTVQRLYIARPLERLETNLQIELR